MVLFKSCPRCSGDRTMENDLYGCYFLCLAFGYVTYPKVNTEKPHRAERKTKSAYEPAIPDLADPEPFPIRP